MGSSVQPSVEHSLQLDSREDLNMAELGLKKKEVDAIDFAFDVYDFKGDGQVDAFYAGDLMRACNINPTLKTITEIGGQAEKCKKMLSKADCYPKNLMKELCEPEDDEGFMPFKPFLERMWLLRSKSSILLFIIITFLEKLLSP